MCRFSEDLPAATAAQAGGPWTNDEVTVTNRYGLRSGMAITQPGSQFILTNTWDAVGRWNTVGGTPGTFTYQYASGSASSLPIAIGLPGGGYITNQYDSLARLTRTELQNNAGSILNAYGYQYNSAHQRTLIGRTNSALSSYNGYVLAEYDGAGQLIKAWTYQPDGTPVTSQKWTYGYDPAQNLNKRTNNLAVETFSVNVLNQLASIPDSTPAYDRRGNLVTRTFSGARYWTYTFDHENRLTSVTTDAYYTPEASRFRVEFVYDGQSRLRIKREYIWSGGSTSVGLESAGVLSSGGWMLSVETRYVYEGLLSVQERNSSNVPTVTYTRGRDLSGSLDGGGGIGGLLARSHGYSSGSWTYHNFYHADGSGNVTALVNSGGTLQASYIYDPDGRYLTGTGTLSSGNAMRFSSKPWVAFLGSSTSGLYYYGYRFYDAYLQRWLNRDPVGEYGGLNLYAMALNCPIAWVDPFGEGTWRIQETNVDLGHPAVTVKAEVFGNPEGFEVQYIADPGECDGGEIILFQTISSTGLAGQFAHVDARYPKPGQLPPRMTPKGSTPYSYVDSPGDGDPLKVSTFRITAVAVCRCNGSDTLLSTYYFEFSNKSRRIDTRRPEWRKHYQKAMRDWKKKGGKIPN